MYCKCSNRYTTTYFENKQLNCSNCGREIKQYITLEDKNMQIQKPPLGLKPRETHDKLRSLEIVQAMDRYIQVGKEIPQEWIDELLDYIQK